MSIQELRLRAASLDLRVHIERAATSCRAALGLPTNPAAEHLLLQQVRQASPRFATSARILGHELRRTEGCDRWVPCAHIQELPAYLSLATAKELAASAFERFASQTLGDYEQLIAAGEFPFCPQFMTLRDQFGSAIATMEAEVVQGRAIGVWVTQSHPSSATSTARHHRDQAAEINAIVGKLRAGGAAAHSIAGLRRKAEKHTDSASVIELASLIAD